MHGPQGSAGFDRRGFPGRRPGYTAAAVFGGFLGAAVGSSYYYGYPYYDSSYYYDYPYDAGYYYSSPPVYGCYLTSRRVWTGRKWVWRRVRACY